MSTVTAVQADVVTDTLGINAHPHYGVSDPTNVYAKDWIPLVINAGIRHVRVNPPSSGSDVIAATKTACDRMVAAGIDLLYVADGPTGLNYLTSSTLPTPAAVESYNERDLTNNSTHIADIQAFQPTLYSQAKARWPGVTVLGPSYGNPTHMNDAGSLAPNVDAINVHAYTAGAQIPEIFGTYLYYFAKQALIDVQSPGSPRWFSETGLNEGASVPSRVSHLTAARLMPRILLQCVAYGIPRAYFYELADQHSGPGAFEDAWGIHNYDLTPKPGGAALINLAKLLSDPGSAFTPGSLDITTDAPANVAWRLFQKRNGDFYLAFWRPLDVASNPTGDGSPMTSGSDLADNPQPISFTFDRWFQSALLHRPMSGTDPVQDLGPVYSLTVTAQLDVQVIRLQRAGHPGSRGLRNYFDGRPGSAG